MIMSRIQLRHDYPSLAHIATIALSNSYGRHQVLWSLFEEAQRFLYHEEPPRRGGAPTPTYFTLSDIQPKGDAGVFRIESKPYEPVISNGERLSFSLRANPVIKRKRQNRKNSAKHDVVMDAQRAFLFSLLGDSKRIDQSPPPPRSDLYRSARETVEDDRSALERQIESWFVDEDAGAILNRSQALSAEDAIRMVTMHAGEVAARLWLERKGERVGFRLIEPKRTLVTEGYMRHTFQKARKRGSRPVTFSSIDFHGVLEVTERGAFSRALTDGIGSAKGFGCGLLLVKRVR
ncbi:MAG: type I-E CRISPR-associated protein Cas6/Cse3/CasE [Alkalispirochaeta sp.]